LSRRVNPPVTSQARQTPAGQGRPDHEIGARSPKRPHLNAAVSLSTDRQSGGKPMELVPSVLYDMGGWPVTGRHGQDRRWGRGLASIDRTACPRFKRVVSTRELAEAFTPTLEEVEWARSETTTEQHFLALVVLLKCYQRLGCFPDLSLEREGATPVQDEWVDFQHVSGWRTDRLRAGAPRPAAGRRRSRGNQRAPGCRERGAGSVPGTRAARRAT
jgi:hypothetical protein